MNKEEKEESVPQKGPPMKEEKKGSGWGKKLVGGLFVFGAVWSAIKAVKRFLGKLAGKVISKIIGTVSKGGLKSLLKLASKLGSKKAAVKVGTKVAGSVVAKEGAKVATKVGVKVASELTPKLVGKIGEETVKKTGAKLLSWGALKSLAKKVPLVSLAAGGAFAIGRALKGDYAGAVMELGSGALACIPGVGTAASLGMDAAIIGRDIMKVR